MNKSIYFKADVYNRVLRRAKAKKRSISSVVDALLRKAMGM